MAGSAILISVMSLVVAVGQSRTMQKQVAAASWPLLQFVTSNNDERNRLSISLSVQNAGVGPAIIKRFRVLYGGKSYKNPYELVRDCCGYLVTNPDPTKFAAGAPASAPVEGTVIKAGEATTLFKLDLAKTNASAWKRLDEARFKLSFDACYCSVLNECWSSDLIGVEPRKVDACQPAQISK